MLPNIISDGNFTLVGPGKCQDQSGELYSNIMLVREPESLPVISQEVEICSSQCAGFGTDGLVGFSHAHKADQMYYFCFCYYDGNAKRPLEATSTNFASYSEGTGPVAGSDDRADHVCYEYTPPLPSVSPSSSPTASPTSPTVSPTTAPTQTSYFSDNVFSLVGLGRCLDGQGGLIPSDANHSGASVNDCSDMCIASMGSRFVGFHYNHADSNCACLYSDGRVESSDNADGIICFRYIGSWPTVSPTVSPKPTTPPSMSPSTSPTSAPSGTPTSRPSQPQTTEDEFFTKVGTGRCLDSEDLQYIVRSESTSNRDTESANRCGEICTAHFESSGEFIVGFEITEGVSCDCLVSQDVIVAGRRLSETQNKTQTSTALGSLDATLGEEEPTTRKLSANAVPNVAWFRSGEFDLGSKTWPNAVQGGTSATLSGNGLRRESKSGHGALGVVTALEGTTADSINFGNVIKNVFTICSVTRYTGGAKGRLLNGKGLNWLHGHYWGKAGVAYYNKWVTKGGGTNVAPVTDWVVMCGSNAGSQLKLLNGVDKGTANGGQGGVNLWVNGGGYMPGESSDFAIAEVMVWDRGLTSEEMYGVSGYLMNTYGFLNPGPGSIWSSVSIRLQCKIILRYLISLCCLQPGQPGGGSTFAIAYAANWNTGAFAGKCATYDQHGDLYLQKKCNSESDQQYLYFADKTLRVQGGDKSGQCVWSHEGMFPKFKACPAGTPENDLVWDYDNGQWKSNGGAKCLVTRHGTESIHTTYDPHYTKRLVMRDCPESNVALPNVAWFGSGTFDLGSKKWPNHVAGGTDATLSGNGLTRESKSGHGAFGAVTALEGTTADKIDFGNVIKPQFTICSVTRYTGGTKGRILNGEGLNWLHGQHGGKAGVAYYEGWKTRSDGTNVAPITDWVVMCGTNAGSQLKLVNGADKGTADYGSGGGELRVNDGWNMPQQTSDFAIAEVMVWNRGLTSEEMYGVSHYLMNSYSLLRQTCFSSKQQLRDAINAYIECNDDVNCKKLLGYGYPIGNWCTGQVTDMSYIFHNKDTFNEPLTNWDTSRVTNFAWMFAGNRTNYVTSFCLVNVII